MNLANRPWKLYLRLAVVVGVLLAALVVLFMNRTNYVQVWFFGFTSDEKVNVVWLMLSTALGTLTARRVFAFSRGLWRDLRDAPRAATVPAGETPGVSAAKSDMDLALPLRRPADAVADPGLDKE